MLEMGMRAVRSPNNVPVGLMILSKSADRRRQIKSGWFVSDRLPGVSSATKPTPISTDCYITPLLTKQCLFTLESKSQQGKQA